LKSNQVTVIEAHQLNMPFKLQVAVSASNTT